MHCSTPRHPQISDPWIPVIDASYFTLQCKCIVIGVGQKFHRSLPLFLDLVFSPRYCDMLVHTILFSDIAYIFSHLYLFFLTL